MNYYSFGRMPLNETDFRPVKWLKIINLLIRPTDSEREIFACNSKCYVKFFVCHVHLHVLRFMYSVKRCICPHHAPVWLISFWRYPNRNRSQRLSWPVSNCHTVSEVPRVSAAVLSGRHLSDPPYHRALHFPLSAERIFPSAYGNGPQIPAVSWSLLVS